MTIERKTGANNALAKVRAGHRNLSSSNMAAAVGGWTHSK